MVNIEALLSPSGGYNYDRTLNTGTTGLIGAFLFDKGIHTMFEKHAIKYFRKNISPRSKLSSLEKHINAKYKKAIQQIDQATDVSNITKGTQAGTDLRQKKYKQFTEARIKRNAKIKAANQRYSRDIIRKSEKSFIQNLRKSRSAFRGIGITMLLSAGFELAEALATPGISKVAAQKEQQFMSGAGTPLDSQGSYTMRQRAVMAIHDSMMNVRQVIGNEAQFMHR